ncbi:MAG TPA: ribonuclease Z [Candidatus Dormibacteraeota bacterium]
MELAFLGTGAAFSLERYNGAVVVDRRFLLDAGAPLLPHMHKLGIDPGDIDAVLVTHYHGDHLLGLPPFMLHRAFIAPRPLVILGPPGVEAALEALMRLAWGDDWTRDFRSRFNLIYDEAGARGTLLGVPYETVPLKHGERTVTGYRLQLGELLLAYSGDTEATPALDALVDGADAAIVEATGPGEPFSHTSWEQAQELAQRHPKTRFFFNHVYAGSLDGAVADFEVVTL